MKKEETVSKKEVAATTTVEPKKPEATKIWEEIKDIPLDLFGLPNQTASMYCKPVLLDGDKLFFTLTTGAQAVFAAMDNALNKKYDLELVDKWYSVTRKSNK